MRLPYCTVCGVTITGMDSYSSPIIHLAHPCHHEIDEKTQQMIVAFLQYDYNKRYEEFLKYMEDLDAGKLYPPAFR